MREVIMSAAKRLPWGTGYESMSPRKVMDASGAGQGSLYHHVRGKRGLAAAALAEVEAEMIAAIEAAFAPERPPLERLREYLLAKRDGLVGCRLGRLANEVKVLRAPQFQACLARDFARVETRARPWRRPRGS